MTEGVDYWDAYSKVRACPFCGENMKRESGLIIAGYGISHSCDDCDKEFHEEEDGKLVEKN